MTDDVRQLQRIAAALRDRRSFSADDAEMAALVIEQFIEAETSSERDYAARDRLIAEAAERFFGHIESKKRRAELIAERLARYFQGPDWRSDRLPSETPILQTNSAIIGG